MARIRSIHPGLFTDEAFVSLSAFARLLLLGLLTEADDHGIFEWKPVQMKMRLLGGDNVDVPALLEEITAADRVMAYEVDGKKYGAIKNFCKYQRPKTPKAIHPKSETAIAYVRLFPKKEETTPAEQEQFPQKGEIPPQMEEGGDKMEEKKEEAPQAAPVPKASPRGTRLPADWRATPEQLQFARDCGHDPIRVETVFRNYWHSTAGAKGVKLDWDKTWDNWCLKDAKHVPAAAAGPPVNPADALWLDRIDGLRKRGFWSDDLWGPRPGVKGCRIPPHILEKAA
jgi:hypothetical protein